jgi:hypothetical protein
MSHAAGPARRINTKKTTKGETPSTMFTDYASAAPRAMSSNASAQSRRRLRTTALTNTLPVSPTKVHVKPEIVRHGGLEGAN